MAPPNVTHLTNRILHHPDVEYAWRPWPTYELSAWIRDELLVSEDATPNERALLDKLGWKKTSSVLSKKGKVALPARVPGVKDIEIWTPKDPGNFAMVERVMAELLSMGKEPLVSPNHLLVPCNYGCYCPAYAPFVLAPQPNRAAKMEKFVRTESPVHVVVIDTGYIKKAPLEVRRDLGGFDNYRGEVWNGNAWVLSQEDDSYTLAGGVLELLDGHGTFTAGEIAERCPRAKVTVVGIREVESAATEASVAREIFRWAAEADVIVPVFAFHELGGLSNWTFTNILPQLKETSVVVCPAGNESSRAKHYPAALQWPDYPVVGVGSFKSMSPSSVTLSDFTNYGDWVFGYTGGERVPGLYFKLNTKVEDGPDKKLPYQGWASWSGTSFAAPKVAAYLANRAAAGSTARNAAAYMKANAPQFPMTPPNIAGVGASVGLDLRQYAR